MRDDYGNVSGFAASAARAPAPPWREAVKRAKFDTRDIRAAEAERAGAVSPARLTA